MADECNQGTLIRIFDTKNGEKRGELRRGTVPTVIHDLNFDQESLFLTCCSDRAKVHIFKVPQAEAPGGNVTSYFSMLSSVVSLAGSEWSFAQFKLDPEEISPFGTKAVVYQGHLHVLTKKGKYFRVKMGEQGGELQKDEVQLLIS